MKGASLYDWDSGMNNVKVKWEMLFEFEDQYVQAKNVNIKFSLTNPSRLTGGSRGIAPFILEFGNRSTPLYPRERTL